MRKFFNVKVNGVSYNVEVEEVLQSVETKHEQIHIVKELIENNATAKIPAITDDDLVPMAMETNMEETFISQYNSMYTPLTADTTNSPISEGWAPTTDGVPSGSFEETAVIEPETALEKSNETLFDFDSPKFTHTTTIPIADLPETPKKVGKNSVLAPLSGKITALPIEPGMPVRCGDILCIIDTDGVESEIMSPIDAEVVGIFVNNGNIVKTNDILFTLT